MISPDIIKHSAVAGLVGAATIGGLLTAVSLADGPGEAEGDSWADPAYVTYSSADRRSPDRHHGRIVDPDSPEFEAAETGRADERGQSLEERNRAARRALEGIEKMYDKPQVVAPERSEADGPEIEQRRGSGEFGAGDKIICR